MSDLQTKPMPPAAAVQVMRWRPNPDTGVNEPWPVATVEINIAGQITFRGDASKAYEPLLRAAKKTAARLVEQSLRDAMQEAKQLHEEAKL